MSLIRLTLAIGSAASYWITFTAPTKSAAQEERPKQSLDELTIGLTKTLHPVVKVSLANIEEQGEIDCLWIVCLIFAVLVSTLSFYFPDQAVPLLIRSFCGPRFPEPLSAQFIITSLSAILAGVIRIACYRTLGKFFTFHLSIRKTHYLVTTGPYAYVRHPSYTALILSITSAVAIHFLPDSWMQTSGLYAVPVVRFTLWMWLVHTFISSLDILLRMAEEDNLLKQTFGNETA